MAGEAFRLMMRAGLACVLALLLSPQLRAAEASPDAQAEIAGLIEALGSSDCRFERNGKWYEAGEAKAHLQRKYDWMRRRDLATSSEQFIERAASHSSVSGRPYHVQCPGQAPQVAADWFRQQLQRLRAAPK
ncbi:hypothetical protein IP90_01467 [Luteimonas cucumeris]|uniref:DUF5329 domain-containing protein n=1 Tax=Luteimonas cucumeris TaxID=985012 RepID=A0A562L7N7_9GAMM|nr:DUF5329 domain-containing protein [Luteimonas cucumeris]TWI03653.1 hypothetical protein IP90_01467 [Luteimonas cucumeris]